MTELSSSAALADAPRQGGSLAGPKVMTVCFDQEPHLNMLVNLKLEGEGYIEPSLPSQTECYLKGWSFVEESTPLLIMRPLLLLKTEMFLVKSYLPSR